MAATDRTTVSERGGVQIPADVREELRIEPGDTIRWTVTDDGELAIEVVSQGTGAFDDFQPVSGPPTNAARIERERDWE
jgi:AbrB family looped-hinge helix DNA binding protein